MDLEEMYSDDYWKDMWEKTHGYLFLCENVQKEHANHARYKYFEDIPDWFRIRVRYLPAIINAKILWDVLATPEGYYDMDADNDLGNQMRQKHLLLLLNEEDEELSKRAAKELRKLGYYLSPLATREEHVEIEYIDSPTSSEEAPPDLTVEDIRNMRKKLLEEKD